MKKNIYPIPFIGGRAIVQAIEIDLFFFVKNISK